MSVKFYDNWVVTGVKSTILNDHQSTMIIPIVVLTTRETISTAVYDHNDTSFPKRDKGSNKYFIVISIGNY